MQLLEKMLNRYLALDPESKRKQQMLQGKAVTVELLGTGLTRQMIFSAQGVMLKAENFVTPDTIIRSAPLSLVHIALAKQQRKNLFANNATVEGDLDVAQDVMALFDELEIDWEEFLSRWAGDVPAHHAGKAVRKLQAFGQKIADMLVRNVNEYVHEEVDLFPPREALQDFFHDVDVLRMDVDRLEARMAELEKDDL